MDMIKPELRTRLETAIATYRQVARGQDEALRQMAIAELPEIVYNSNAIENSTLTLRDTEDIILRDQIKKDHDIREIYETRNLARVIDELYKNPYERLTASLILSLHQILLTGVNDEFAGRFRRNKEWVRIGAHIGANPAFVSSLVSGLVQQYHDNRSDYFIDNIAYFHAEFEIIHPFNDGNGRIGRVVINQQLAALGLPPIIIRNKNKYKDYYPLFDTYRQSNTCDSLTELLTLLLLESLHKRITLLTSANVISLTDWAKQRNVSPSAAANRAKRQTLPAFRVSDHWMIDAEYEKV